VNAEHARSSRVLRGGFARKSRAMYCSFPLFIRRSSVSPTFQEFYNELGVENTFDPDVKARP
jgi:hypothetical protein